LEDEYGEVEKACEEIKGKEIEDAARRGAQENTSENEKERAQGEAFHGKKSAGRKACAGGGASGERTLTLRRHLWRLVQRQDG
jgi:hypothetical protein